MGFEPTTLSDLVGCSTTELLETFEVSKKTIEKPNYWRINGGFTLWREVNVPS